MFAAPPDPHHASDPSVVVPFKNVWKKAVIEEILSKIEQEYTAAIRAGKNSRYHTFIPPSAQTRLTDLLHTRLLRAFVKSLYSYMLIWRRINIHRESVEAEELQAAMGELSISYSGILNKIYVEMNMKNIGKRPYRPPHPANDNAFFELLFYFCERVLLCLFRSDEWHALKLEYTRIFRSNAFNLSLARKYRALASKNKYNDKKNGSGKSNKYAHLHDLDNRRAATHLAGGYLRKYMQQHTEFTTTQTLQLRSPLVSSVLGQPKILEKQNHRYAYGPAPKPLEKDNNEVKNVLSEKAASPTKFVPRSTRGTPRGIGSRSVVTSPLPPSTPAISRPVSPAAASTPTQMELNEIKAREVYEKQTGRKLPPSTISKRRTKLGLPGTGANTTTHPALYVEPPVGYDIHEKPADLGSPLSNIGPVFPEFKKRGLFDAPVKNHAGNTYWSSELDEALQGNVLKAYLHSGSRTARLSSSSRRKKSRQTMHNGLMTKVPLKHVQFFRKRPRPPPRRRSGAQTAR